MKKKKSSGGANWMDTYGDMVTLLLCFFVLLYSMSTISEEAWKNLVMSFNPYAVADELPVQNSSEGPSSEGNEAGVMPDPEETDQEKIDEEIENLFVALQALANMSESVSASNDGGRIYITFDGTTFFKGDSSALTAEAVPVLENIAQRLSESAYAIDEVRVSGHTAQYSPDQPNDPYTDRFLSSERAARVVAYIQSLTNPEVLDPAKLVSEGWGQWHPRGDNDTNEGRAMNRRVEMVISGRDLETEMAEEIPSYTTGPADTAEPDATAAPDTTAAPETDTTPEAAE